MSVPHQSPLPNQILAIEAPLGPVLVVAGPEAVRLMVVAPPGCGG